MYHKSKNNILITSGDGLVSVVDPRKSKPVAVSANQDDELLSISLVRVIIIDLEWN